MPLTYGPKHSQNVSEKQELANKFKSVQFKDMYRKASKRINGGIDTQGQLNIHVTVAGQIQNVQMDTGSSDFGLKSVQCKSCSYVDQMQDPRDSGKPVTIEEAKKNGMNCTDPLAPQGMCGIQQEFIDGSGWNALLYKDSFSFGGDNTVKSQIGSITNATDPFEGMTVAGLLGLAPLQFSTSLAPTPFDDQVRMGQQDNVFAMCFSADNRFEKRQGTLVLGATGETMGLNKGSIQWAKKVDQKQQAVELKHMSVGGVRLNVPSSVYNKGLAVVDSGTTNLSLPESAFKELENLFYALCDDKDLKGICGHTKQQSIFQGHCQKMTKADIAAFPRVQIAISDNVNLQVKPQHQLRTGKVFCSREDYYSMSIDSLGNDDSGTILGMVALEEYLTIFDRKNNMIGFSEADNHKCATNNYI